MVSNIILKSRKKEPMTLVLLKGFKMKDKRPNFLFSKTFINLAIKISQADISAFHFLTYYCNVSNNFTTLVALCRHP